MPFNATSWFETGLKPSLPSMKSYEFAYFRIADGVVTISRERDREIVCVWERERVSVCVRERVCVCVWERKRECVCVCERERVCVWERENGKEKTNLENCLIEIGLENIKQCQLIRFVRGVEDNETHTHTLSLSHTYTHTHSQRERDRATSD